MNICKTCGGPVNRVGNYYVCEYCRNKWEIDSGNDVHAVDRANAWSALRDGDFEKAAELFENIIVKEAKNHEACGAAKPVPVVGWNCSCGQTNIMSKFCPECGAKKPEAPATWDCSCGYKGITSKFCPECGNKREG